MSSSTYGDLRARLASRTVEHYLRPTFRVRTSADDSGERLRFDTLLEQLPSYQPRHAPRPKTWLVTGGAGSGKSTAVLQYAMALLDRETPCVIVDNRTIRQLLDVKGCTVKKLANKCRPAGLSDALWKAHLKQGRVVFLVDALNELQREFHDTDEWKFVLELVAGGHGFTVLVTSRTESEDLERTILRDVETVAIEPLNEQDIETYLDMRDGSAAEALDEIRSGDMLGVASNPFMLSLLTDWLLGTRSVGNRKIPRSRAELLRQTVVRPDGANGVAHAEKQGLGMEAALCAAALAAVTTGKGNADFLEQEVEDLLGRVWDDRAAVGRTVQAFLNTQMVERVGDAADGHYSLIHPAFVDFGLALAWRNTDPPAVTLEPGYLDHCLGDWVGLQSDPDEAVRGLLAGGTTHLPPELLVDVLLANRGVLGDEVRRELWQRLGRCFNQRRQTRDRLAGALAGLPPTVLRDGLQHGLLRTIASRDPRFADAVMDALRNGTLDALALQRLGRVSRRSKDKSARKRSQRDEARATEARASLRGQADPLVRRHSANWLISNGTKQDVGVLRAAVLSDPHPPVRGASAKALGRIGDPAAVPALAQAVTDDADAVVRGSAADALGRIGDPAALPTLAHALTHDGDEKVRGSAASALGRIGDPAALPELTRALTHDTENNVRGSAADALGGIGDPAALPELTRALTDDDEGNVRGTAANALGRIGDPAALPTLTRALDHDRDEKVRGTAANALGRIGDPAALPTLTRAVTQDADAAVRGSAANALGRIGDAAALPPLTQVLTSDVNAVVRGSTADALGRIGDPAALPTLAKVLTDDTDAAVRGSAANALGRVGDPAALPELTRVLADDTDAHTRGSAAKALGRIGDSTALPELTRAVTHDRDEKVRGSAADALGRIGDPAALPELTRVLADDADAHTRGSAAKALGRIGDPAALPELTRAVTHDRDEKVRGTAADALGRIGDPAAADILRATIDDVDETYPTRRAAVGSLAHLDTEDESWIMKVADRLRFSTAGDREGRALRGAIVDLVARREITPVTRKWLVDVVHKDADPMNRTTALEGLARAGQAEPELITFVIAPERPRPDKRPRDTDAGVLGVAATAVVRAAVENPDYTDSLLPGVARMLAHRNTYWSSIVPPLAQLRLLPLPVAENLFARLDSLLAASEPENRYLPEILERARASLADRRRVQTDIDSFTTQPEAVLAAFREQRRSRFDVTPPATDEACQVALLTAVPVEAKALFHVLEERGITTVEVQRHGRYYDVFELAGSGRPVRVVATQATDQGGQSAAAVTHDLLSAYRPDLVLLVGVCGGLGERGVSLGDVLFAREVFDYNPEKVRPQGGGLRPQVYRTDEQALRLVNKLHNRNRLDRSLEGHDLLVKDFASGEKVIAARDSELRAELLALSADIGGVETEGHGVLHTVWEAFKAKGFVGGAMLKCVSDLCDEEMTVDKRAKQTEAARRAVRVALDVAEAFRRADA